MGLLDGRVAIVTGAGRGIGREEALLLAKHGAKVVVNDLGGGHDGAGNDTGPAASVVGEIRTAGGEAVANAESVSDWKAAERMVRQAIDTFGALHVVVNNAGILRDRMIFNMDESDVDSVLGVHLKGTFALTRHACVYWREQHKAGKQLHGRIINTSSDSGLLGNAGQTNYGAAKAGIAALTVIAAKEMARYGVTANAVAPSAVTRMTVDAMGRGSVEQVPQQMIDAAGPAHVAPLVAWLASEQRRARERRGLPRRQRAREPLPRLAHGGAGGRLPARRVGPRGARCGHGPDLLQEPAAQADDGRPDERDGVRPDLRGFACTR